MEEEIKLKGLIDGLKGVSVNYIKLIKNSKGYNWEFKILDLDLDKVIQLNTKLTEHFGGEQE
jgi:hypothetical protein